MATNESDKQSKKQKLRNSRRCLTVGTWNVRTLVESVGDERICRKVSKPGNHRNDHGMVDRKLDEGTEEVWGVHRRDSGD